MTLVGTLMDVKVCSMPSFSLFWETFSSCLVCKFDIRIHWFQYVNSCKASYKQHKRKYNRTYCATYSCLVNDNYRYLTDARTFILIIVTGACTYLVLTTGLVAWRTHIFMFCK